VNAPVVMDGGDGRCVLLLIELRRLTLRVQDGTVIHLITTDPAAPLDLPAWCHLTGHAYLGPVPSATVPTYVLRASNSAAVTDPDHPWRPVPTAP
jgi:tRNA 2-thiouridine synthesizing protein A